MTLDAKRSRHITVAIADMRVKRGIAVSLSVGHLRRRCDTVGPIRALVAGLEGCAVAAAAFVERV